jgi:L-lactate dehydrogenase complex protein LldE
MRVQLFIPCFVDQLFPDTAWNMVKVLEKCGCEVAYNPAQTCCGQPAFNAGYQNECASVATSFTTHFDADGYIVAPGGSCTGFVRNYYHQLLNGPQPIQKKLYELSEFLVEVLHRSDLSAVLPGRAVYHDACGALRECGIKASPRTLLKNVKGLELIETEDCEVCCGFGGTFAVKNEAISTSMAEQKIVNAAATGAEYIISTDLSCLMQLEGYIKKHNYPLRTMHIADVLASGW